VYHETMDADEAIHQSKFFFEIQNYRLLGNMFDDTPRIKIKFYILIWS
jgi:hypothetical protein